jgi:hypothetical protein
MNKKPVKVGKQVISWEWMKMKLTKEETKGLADFLYNAIGEKK